MIHVNFRDVSDGRGPHSSRHGLVASEDGPCGRDRHAVPQHQGSADDPTPPLAAPQETSHFDPME